MDISDKSELDSIQKMIKKEKKKTKKEQTKVPKKKTKKQKFGNKPQIIIKSNSKGKGKEMVKTRKINNDSDIKKQITNFKTDGMSYLETLN